MKSFCLKKMDSYTNGRTLAYLSVVGGFLVHLCLGSIYTYGNMGPYIQDFMNNITSHSKVTVGNSMWIFGLAVFGLGSSMTLGAFIDNKIGPRLTVLLGCWIMSFGVIITSVTIYEHLALVAISYGLIAGVGTGIAYGVSLATPIKWFPKSKGLVSGIIVAGFGLGPMIFDFLQTYYINATERSLDVYDYPRVPKSFIIIGVTYVIIQLIGSLMMTQPKKTPEVENEDIERNLSNILTDNLLYCLYFIFYIHYNSGVDKE